DGALDGGKLGPGVFVCYHFAGSVPSHRDRAAPYITARPQATCPRTSKFHARSRGVSRGRTPPRRETFQAEIFPYSSLRSPSRAYISRSDTWNRRAVPPLLL